MTTLSERIANPATGHVIAFLTVLVWGITFVSTKLLLVHFNPIEILFFRFSLGYIALWVIFPYAFSLKGFRQELMFAAAGLCGVTLYFLCENIALTYTTASNVGVITTLAPVLTGLLAFAFLRTEMPNKFFFIGCLFSISGIIIISFNGKIALNLNPIGDGLAVLACFCWACYSILIKKIACYGYNTIQITRRCFFYGLLFMLPALPLLGFELNLSLFTHPSVLLNLLFLGFGASAICFVSWNFAVKQLGAVKISVYIYLVPIITIITAIIVLNEQLTLLAGFGTLLTLLGLIISEKNRKLVTSFAHLV